MTFTCRSAERDAEVRIAQLPSTGTFIAGLLVGLIVPLVLGLIGIVILIVTGVLWATRPPRPKKLGRPACRARYARVLSLLPQPYSHQFRDRFFEWS